MYLFSACYLLLTTYYVPARQEIYVLVQRGEEMSAGCLAMRRSRWRPRRERIRIEEKEDWQRAVLIGTSLPVPRHDRHCDFL